MQKEGEPSEEENLLGTTEAVNLCKHLHGRTINELTVKMNITTVSGIEKVWAQSCGIHLSTV